MEMARKVLAHISQLAFFIVGRVGWMQLIAKGGFFMETGLTVGELLPELAPLLALGGIL